MAISRCPGQDRRYWRSQDVFDAPCPYCGKSLEFWKNEPRRRCTGCGRRVLNPKLDMGCAKWCKFAGDCLGMNVEALKDESLCDALIAEMKKVFGHDHERIHHALEVLHYAETILLAQEADPLVVKASAVLYDVAAREARAKRHAAATRCQEMEGPRIARRILTGDLRDFQIAPERVDHVCRIVGSRHAAGGVDTPESRIVRDADRLVGIGEECAGKDRAALEAYVERMFRTPAGRALAAGKMLDGPTPPPAGRSSQ